MHGEPHPTYNLGLDGGQEENWHVLNYMVHASILRAQTCIASRARLFLFNSTDHFCIGMWRGRVWRLRTSWCEHLERNYWISHLHVLHAIKVSSLCVWLTSLTGGIIRPSVLSVCPSNLNNGPDEWFSHVSVVDISYEAEATHVLW